VRYRSGMKLTDDTQRGTNLIRAYAPGEIRIGERAIAMNCIVTADRLLEWPVQSLATMTPADLEPLIALQPEIVILGSGSTQQFPDASLLGAILSRGIGCEVMNTGAACRTYNVLVSEDRRVAAALILNDGFR
jgi:uncharacterized protein